MVIGLRLRRPRAARAAARHGMSVAALTMALAVSACGGSGDDPFAEAPRGEDGAPLSTTAITAPEGSPAPDPATASTPSPPAASTPQTPPAPPATKPADPAKPAAPAAEAPSPAGVTPDAATKAGKRPHSLAERIEADNTAKLNVRTMVSIIEGCHSGRDSYKACNSHQELGSPDLLGLRIGKARGEIQIAATDNSFRITGHSMSGAKFTVARGPGGDRFKCIAGRMPGACPPDRSWTW